MNQFYITSKNEYIEVDYAKSARSHCRVCKKAIAKNQIRISISIDDDHFQHFQGKYWHHLHCFQIKPRFKSLDPEKQIYNIDQLEDNDYDQVVDYMKKQIERFEIGKRKSKKSQSDESYVYKQPKARSNKKQKSKGRSVSKKKEKSQEKKKVQSMSQKSQQISEKQQNHSQTQQTPKKQIKKNTKKSAKKKPKAKSNGYSANEKKLYKEYYDDFKKMTLDQLKNILVLNHQTKTGVKSQLLEKCADGKLLGQIPLCKTCGGGRLRFNRQTGIYKCPGFMDDEDFKRCGVSFTRDQIQRQKWINS